MRMIHITRDVHTEMIALVVVVEVAIVFHMMILMMSAEVVVDTGQDLDLDPQFTGVVDVLAHHLLIDDDDEKEKN